MDLKEKIVNKIILDGGGGAAYYDGIIYDGEAGSLHEAMDELSKIVAIAFAKFISEKRIHFDPVIKKWWYCKTWITHEKLFQLFTQSKEYKELMDGK